MFYLVLLFIFILGSFFYVVLFGAPYLPTFSHQINVALDLMNLDSGATVLDLGCGDGRFLREAARQNLKVIGYEINPILYLVAFLSTRRYGKNVKIVFGNYWQLKLPPSDGIFVFLLPKFMTKLDNKMLNYKYKPVKLVTFAFEVPSRKVIKSKDNVFLYQY